MVAHRLIPALALLFTLVAPLLAQESPDFNAARTAFKREIGASRLEKRKAVIRDLVATRDARALKELRVAANKVKKEMKKQDKKLEPLRKKRDQIDAKINKRVGKKTTVGVGLIQNLLDEKEEILQEIAKKSESLKKEELTYDALRVGIGDLVSSLEGAAAGEATNDLVKLAERIRKPEDRLDAIELLGFIHTPEAVLGLVGLALNSEDPVTRISALDALVLQGDSRGAEAAIAALDDDFWQVRAAAARALSRFGSPAAITRLITALESEEGRLRDDIRYALRSMAGVDLKDNATLWKRWWTDKKENLTSAYQDLDHAEPAARANARDTIRSEGFLLGVRRILDQAGLSLNAIRRDDARRRAQALEPEKNGEGASVEEAAFEILLDDVGGALASRPKEIRDRALNELLLGPLERTREQIRQRTFVRMIGRTRSPLAARVLMRRLRNIGGDEEKAAKMRLAVIDGLGYCAGDDEVGLLARRFGRSDSPPAELVALAGALRRVGTKKAARQLITALGEIESRSDGADMSGVVKAVGDALRELTSSATTGGYKEWLAWWKDGGESLETERDKEVAKSGKKAKEEEGDDKYGFYGIETNSKRLCFVIDISGSMNEPADYAGSNRTKIEVAKEELIRAISGLPKDARFNIIAYSTELTLWNKKLQLADAKGKSKAKAWVAKLQAAGATNIYESLTRAFDYAGRGTFDRSYKSALDTIFFLSDGQPTAGRIQSIPEIEREILEKNRLRRVAIHTIGVGRTHARQFMRNLATRTGGQYVAR